MGTDVNKRILVALSLPVLAAGVFSLSACNNDDDTPSAPASTVYVPVPSASTSIDIVPVPSASASPSKSVSVSPSAVVITSLPDDNDGTPPAAPGGHDPDQTKRR